MANETIIRVACPQCCTTYECSSIRLGSQQKCSQCGLVFMMEAAEQNRPSVPVVGPQSHTSAQPVWTHHTQYGAPVQQNCAPPQMQRPYGYQPTYPPPQQYYQPYAYPRVPTSGSAIASLILGIASILFYPLGLILGPLALHYGRTGLDQADMQGFGGRGMAVAGRVTGIIGIIFGALFLFAVIMSAAAGGGSDAGAYGAP